MDSVFLAVVLVPLLVLITALAIWTLASLATEERWGLFILAMPFFLPVGIWLLWQRRPHLELADASRLLLDGAIVTAALFLPLWVALAAFLILLGMEIQAIFYGKVGQDLYLFSSEPRKETGDKKQKETSDKEKSQETAAQDFPDLETTGVSREVVFEKEAHEDLVKTAADESTVKPKDKTATPKKSSAKAEFAPPKIPTKSQRRTAGLLEVPEPAEEVLSAKDESRESALPDKSRSDADQ